MKLHRLALHLLCATGLALAIHGGAGATTEEASREFTPIEGQAGKDVVWVPTPEELTERMLDLAQVTPKDFVIDLGSGDGRNVIAAARRGARALGVEYNPDMVVLSRRNAAQAGVVEKAHFVQGDMYAADISEATVMALFFLPENLRRLTPKFLALRPGTRIVANTFGIPGWTQDYTLKMEEPCDAWCLAMLYIVPAKVAGTWRLGGNRLELKQNFQDFTGSHVAGRNRTAVIDGRLLGDRINFRIGKAEYEGRVKGDVMEGFIHGGGTWTARRSS